jgi:phospholipase A-2-activating protein
VSGGKDQLIHVQQPSQALGDDAEALLVGHGSNVCALDVSPDGSLIISGSWDTDARVWQVGKWDDSTVLQGHSASVWAVLAYDNSTIITGTHPRGRSGTAADLLSQVAQTRRFVYSTPLENLCGR